MVSTVITFTKADVQPPVYIAGGFTDWAPVEMQCESSQSGQNKFTHTTELQPGEHQYKFRLGPGDWWVLDESAPTADDGSGNINNAFTVTAEETKVSSPQPTEDVARAPVPAAPFDTLDAVEEELEVRPDTTTADVDTHKEASIPDVAPPPYSVEEHAISKASEPANQNLVPKVPDIEKSVESKAQPSATNGGLAKKMLLVAAIVAIPVAISFFLRR